MSKSKSPVGKLPWKHFILGDLPESESLRDEVRLAVRDIVMAHYPKLEDGPMGTTFTVEQKKSDRSWRVTLILDVIPRSDAMDLNDDSDEDDE